VRTGRPMVKSSKGANASFYPTAASWISGSRRSPRPDDAK
jgi:hypothetical protein